MRIRVLILWAGVVGSVLLALTAMPLAARPSKPIPHTCDPVASACAAVRNDHVRVDIGPSGSWAMGTTGGDPSTPLDDDKTMIYGFKPGGYSDIGSSYTTVRITGPAGAEDILPTVDDTVAQISESGSVHTVWAWTTPHRVRVTETVRLADNPFSGRRDGVTIEYDVVNEDTVGVSVGVRALLDVKLHRNDGAPYIVPGVGAVTTEREFVGDSVPPFWQAFESPTYDPRELRSVGILDVDGVTPPDRFVIAYWFDIQDKLWEYPVDSTKTITKDSAVALFWEPEVLQPREHRQIITGYGQAGDRGGSAFLSGPVDTQCGTTVPMSLFVTNFDTVPLTGGQATLSLPTGLSFAPGQSATVPIATIAPGDTGSVVWQVEVGPATSGDRTITAAAEFDAGRRFEATFTMTVTCDQPTLTPTTPSPVTPEPTATTEATRTPMATNTPMPDAPSACAFLQGRVPPAVVASALANPARVAGWNELANPSAPPSPYNRPRRMLTMQNISVPYHPLFNPVVFKAGCP